MGLHWSDVSPRSLFTMSYSLSMIPSYFALLNRIDDL
jgi:hypothetical protein